MAQRTPVAVTVPSLAVMTAGTETGIEKGTERDAAETTTNPLRDERLVRGHLSETGNATDTANPVAMIGGSVKRTRTGGIATTAMIDVARTTTGLAQEKDDDWLSIPFHTPLFCWYRHVLLYNIPCIQ